MTRLPPPLAPLFDGEEAGLGRVRLSCPGCGGRTTAGVLEGLLELLCEGCGRNLALLGARALEARQGPEALRLALEALGLTTGAAGEDGLLEALLQRGGLRRDLRLTLELLPERGRYAWGARSLAELALPAEVERGLQARRARGGRLVDHVVEAVRARLAASVRSVGQAAGLPTLRSAEQLDPGCRDALPLRAVEEFRVLPVRRSGEALEVALWDPLDPALLRDLDALAGGAVRPLLAAPELLQELLPPPPARPAPEPGPLAADGVGSLEPEGDRLADLLLEALEEGAEELLLEPAPGGASWRLRVEGELRLPRPLPEGALDDLTARLEALGGAPGQLVRLEPSGWPVALQVQRWEGPWGPRLALRLEAEPGPAPELEGLGLAPAAQAALGDLLARGRGLFVVAGTRRSGKTWGYRALLERAARQGGAVVSLEAAEAPPAEPLAGVSALRLERGRPGRQALAGLLQAPPDWVGVDLPASTGRGRRALDLALEVVLGGGAAVVTVAAPRAELALGRLAGLTRGAPELLNGLGAVAVARRVVPRNCPHCRVLRRDPGGRSSRVGLGCLACGDRGRLGTAALAEAWQAGPDGGGRLAGGEVLPARAQDLLGAGEVPLEAVSDLLVAPPPSAG